MLVNFELNGRQIEMDIAPQIRLVDLLRKHFDLTGTKEGCGQGECGACTVIVDSKAVNSCLILAYQVDGKRVITIEGLSKNGALDPLQEFFISEGAIQCGYCTPGMILSAKALLMQKSDPNEDDIKEALAGNLCRCTGYSQILNAVLKTVEKAR